MKITLVTVGKTDVKWVKEGLDLYKSRLVHYAQFSVSEIPLPGGTGEDEEDRGLPALRTLQVDVPVWSGYAEAFGGEL